MKERVRELWQRDTEKLKKDGNYFIITNKEGAVGGIQYSILGSMFVFSQYSSALLAAEEFGNKTTVEKITRDELFERFWKKFDFFELDPPQNNTQASENTVSCIKENNSITGSLVEIFDRKISERLTEIDIVLENLDKKFHNLKTEVRRELRSSTEFTIRTHKNKLEIELTKFKEATTSELINLATEAVKKHFDTKTKRNGGFKL